MNRTDTDKDDPLPPAPRALRVRAKNTLQITLAFGLSEKLALRAAAAARSSRGRNRKFEVRQSPLYIRRSRLSASERERAEQI